MMMESQRERRQGAREREKEREREREREAALLSCFAPKKSVEEGSCDKARLT